MFNDVNYLVSMLSFMSLDFFKVAIFALSVSAIWPCRRPCFSDVFGEVVAVGGFRLLRLFQPVSQL